MSTPAPATIGTEDGRSERTGIVLVFLSAVIFSFGGALARYLDIEDGWTIVFWRSIFAAIFLLAFMLLRDGVTGTLALFRGMGLPGLFVGLCFATASSAFILALAHTTVANIVLIQAGVPLIAALLARLLFGEPVSRQTWIAIAAVLFGVGVMVSDSVAGEVSPIGDALAILIAFAFAAATLTTRRYANVRMTPAVFFGAAVAASVAASQASTFAVSGRDLSILVAFGAFNFGLGLALFVTGARLIPATLAALLGTMETVLAPLWVAFLHSEIPATRTVVGGVIVLMALLVHLALQMARQRRPAAQMPQNPVSSS